MSARSALVLVCLGFATFGCQQQSSTSAETRSSQPQEPAVSTPQIHADPSRLAASVLDTCKSATVLIGNFEGGALKATGSGVILGQGRVIFTNKHVVTGTDNIVDPCRIAFDSAGDDPRVVTVDPSNIMVFDGTSRSDKEYYQRDLAAIRLDQPVTQFLTLASTKGLSETEAVWAFAYPVGIDVLKPDEALPSPTVHVMRIERIEKREDQVVILQLTGSATHGSSGGPVVNKDGKVLGVLNAKQGESVIFAVPSEQFYSLFKRATGKDVAAKQFTQPIEAREPASPQQPPRPSLKERIYTSGRSVFADLELDEAMLDGFTPMELTLFRNEPFARRGYIFKRREIAKHFEQFEWYSPRTSNLAAIQQSMSGLERRNVDLIRRYQESRGKGW